MTDAAALPTGSRDFETLYDLPEPRPYFRGLEPSGYRLPEVLAGFLRAAAPAVRQARGRGEGATLRLLDFACGYGAVGMLLAHDLAMADLYAHYRAPAASDDPAETVAADAAFFTRHRRRASDYAVGGLDVAGNAVRYALAVEAAKVGFTDDLTAAAPGVSLSLFLERCDLVVEAGALGGLLAPAFERLTAATRAARPWILFCPRPDTDPAPAAAVLEAAGYRVDALGAPVGYRKPLSEAERAEVAAAAAARGVDADAAFDGDGFMRVQMRLARPAAQADTPPLSDLSALVPDG